MAEKIHDQMVERTRRLIQDTMLLLIEDKGFSHVTVRNLTQKARINRGTFYLHYLDKYDLIEQMEDELLNGLRQSMHTIKYPDMLQCYEENAPCFPLVEVFRYLKQNGRLLKGLLGPKGDPAFSQKMRLFLKDGIFADFIDSLEDETISKSYFSAFATSAYLGIIEDWLNHGMQQSPEEMAVIYAKIKFFGMKA